MSGLSYLCDYGDSEESETEESRIIVKEKSKLPVPNLSKVTVCPPDSYCDDPRQHHGRIRTFPHIRGNWATLVYIKCPDDSGILDLLCKIKFVFKTIDETCYLCDNLHISVTKTVVLKYHLITSFTTSLQKIISGIETFELGFDTIEVYTNEEKTRTFVALKADHLSRKFLLRIVEKVDNVLEDYNLPTFYKEPSFHMSILWWKGDLKDAILKHIDELNTILAQEKEVYKKFCIQKVDCKVESGFSNQVLNGPHFHLNGHINKQHSNVNHILQSNAQPSNQVAHQGHLNKMNSLAVKCNNTDIRQDNITSKSRYILVRNQYSQKIDKTNSPQITQSCGLLKAVPSNRLPISKTRYQLIRHKECKNPDQSPLVKKRNLKVSKYNIINLDSIKSKVGTLYSLAKPITFSSSKILNHHDFKIKKHLSYTLKSKEKVRGVFDHTKKTNYKAEIENIKGKSKINNIPCALFCKYGKCLRNINSKCPYVHDKKLVSLCRKFLKGVCHDENCTLSHEISKKKMPTCYFYLNGICVKDNCPYLHVKLGDQASICKDFLKGYCEKGETCKFKHVKPKISRNAIQFTNNIKECLKVKKNIPSKNKKDLLPDKPSTSSEENTALEDRYFKEAVQEDMKYSDYIKPTRCKLGDLPSYIKL